MHYTLRQLEVFLATAHYQNITQAAANLAMSQSAASSALKDLEQRFNIQLFDRAGKRLQLNELGQALRPRAEALLDQARDLKRSLSQHTEMGELKVGATLTIGNYLAVPIMARFMSYLSGRPRSAYRRKYPCYRQPCEKLLPGRGACGRRTAGSRAGSHHLA